MNNRFISQKVKKKKKIKSDTIPLKYANGLRLKIVYNLIVLYWITRDYWLTNNENIFSGF